MKERDVILTPLPQSDNRIKYRPAVILREMPLYRDILVCGISSQLHQFVNDFDELIRQNDNDFISSGLLTDSVIRLGFLAVLPDMPYREVSEKYLPNDTDVYYKD